MLKTNLRLRLQEIYPEKELICWFDPLAVSLDLHQGCVHVAFPHALFAQWFMSFFRKGFEEHARPLCSDMPFVYQGVGPSPQLPSRVLSKKEQEAEAVPFPRIHTFVTEQPAGFFSNVFPLDTPARHQIFDSFFANKKNDFPLAAAKQAVTNANPSPLYIPFVIYGQSGSGKTHLLAAMAHAASEAFPDTTIYYGNGDLFLEKTTLSRYRGKRAFFIDESQRIAQFPELHEKLITFLDTCRSCGIIAVFCFDAHPSACKGLPAKVISRLTGGLVVELKKPDIDIRRRYIHTKNEQFSLNLNKEQELTLAQKYHDFRSIDGVLARITAYRSVAAPQDIDMAVFLEKGEDKKTLTPADILAVTAAYFSLPENEITGKSRNKKAAAARQTAMFLIRDLLGLSLLQIGKIFDGRDHSSILYALKKYEELQKSSKDMNNHMTTLKQLCVSGQP